MDNESTRLINDEPAQNAQPTSAPQPQSKGAKSKRTNSIAAAAGGFVVGATAGAATTMAAATPNNEGELPTEVQEANTEETPDVPTPEQAILANDEGIRYAHVDADNFSEAFEQARHQVGAGGVFEYNGRIYGTFYAEEWNNMSAQDKADFQSRVNEVAPTQHTQAHATHVAEATVHPQPVPANAEMISVESVDNEIRVLGVEAVQNENGQIMNIALVECEGDQALLVDVDNNGSIDVMLHDDNRDGMLQEAEVHNISDAGLNVGDLMQAQAAQEGDSLYGSYDALPDYNDDADSIMTV